jgi:hypothetical protein
LIKFETKGYFVNDVEIQGSNCIDPRAKVFLKGEIFKDKGLIARHQNFRRQIEMTISA